MFGWKLKPNHKGTWFDDSEKIRQDGHIASQQKRFAEASELRNS